MFFQAKNQIDDALRARLENKVHQYAIIAQELQTFRTILYSWNTDTSICLNQNSCKFFVRRKSQFPDHTICLCAVYDIYLLL